MKKKIEFEIVNGDEEKIQKLLARGLANIIKDRIEDFPEDKRIEAYDMLIANVKDKITSLKA